MPKLHKLLNDELIEKVYIYLRNNLALILILLAVALATYGFELFNLNLTIDEEIYSSYDSAPIIQLQKGRWGMFFLYDFLFPFTIIPFVPLFVSLIFQIIAFLLLIQSLNIENKLDQMIVGVICISYPGMLFIYSFSTVNYGIGIGLFFVSLSLLIFVKNNGLKKYWSIVPGVLSISIYQPFIPALLSVYLLYFIYVCMKDRDHILSKFLNILAVNILSVIFYYLLSKLFLFLFSVSSSGYISEFFDIKYFFENPVSVITTLFSLILRSYFGSETIYGIRIYSISLIIIFSAFSLLLFFHHSKIKLVYKVLLPFLCLMFLFVPFLGGILNKGSLPLRNLIAMPFVLAGFVFLGLYNQPRIMKLVTALITLLCFFQFISSSNHLSASSHLSLEADRLLGSRLIETIEEVQAKSGSTDNQYLEVVGFYQRPESLLIPKIETIGASFFEWDQGNPVRIVAFLQTLGLKNLHALPLDERYRVVVFSEQLPNWPSSGSVALIENIIVVKFNSYSQAQRLSICKSSGNRSQLQSTNFCP